LVSGALNELGLSGNSIGPSGATAIADALKVNGALTTLTLDANYIGLSGATAIADALKVNGARWSHSALWLIGNKISDQGASAIGEALKVNGALTHLGVASNEIDWRPGCLRDRQCPEVQRHAEIEEFVHWFGAEQEAPRTESSMRTEGCGVDLSGLASRTLCLHDIVLSAVFVGHLFVEIVLTLKAA
jgi:hypothetical protein